MTKSKLLWMVLCLGLVAVVGGAAVAAPTAEEWEVRATVNELTLAVSFWDKVTGFSAGAKNLIGPRVLKTTDGGYNWDSVLDTQPNAALTDIVWQDENTAYASGSGADLFFGLGNSIIKTSDQGATWDNVWGKTWFSYWTELQVIRPDVIVAAGHWTPFFYTSYGITVSTDGGQTWDEREWNWNWETMGIGAWPSDVDFLDENVGFIAGGVWPTSLTERVIGAANPPSPTLPPMGGGQGRGEGEQWLAIAEMTTDGGLTWTTIFQQEGFALTDIDFVNRNEGWVSGYYATGCCQANSWIYHTTDGGLTWEQQFFGKEGVAAVQAIHFFNRREGWLAGYEAPQALNRTLLYHTTDGGATWVEMDFHPFADPFDLFFFDESEGWAVGPNSAQQGKFLHYTDPTRQPKVNLEVTTHPDSYTPGTQLAWTLHIENVSGEAQTTDVWVYLSSPAIGANSPYPIRLAQGVTLPADLDTTRTLRLTLPGWLPAGFYNVETIIGPFASDDPLQHLAYDSFDVEFLTSR